VPPEGKVKSRDIPKWVSLLPLSYAPQRRGLFWFSEFASDTRALHPVFKDALDQSLIVRVSNASHLPEADANVNGQDTNQRPNDTMDVSFAGGSSKGPADEVRDYPN
jgi:hypothetical protein